MGLGKTVQICAYLKGLFDSDQIKKVIIVVPATLKSYWYAELHKWCYGAPNIVFFSFQLSFIKYHAVRRQEEV